MTALSQCAIIGEKMKKTTITEISKKTGLSISHVFRIMHGERNPSLDAVQKLAIALKLSMATIIQRLKNGSIRNLLRDGK